MSVSSRSPSRGRARSRSIPPDDAPAPRSQSPRRSASRSRTPHRSFSPRARSRSGRGSDHPERNGRLSHSPDRDRSQDSRRYRDGRSPSPRRPATASKSAKVRGPCKGVAREAHEIVQIVIERLTRNVNEEHLREIFGAYGEVLDVDLPMFRTCMCRVLRPPSAFIN